MSTNKKSNIKSLPIRSSSQIKEDDSKAIFINLIKPWMVVSWLEKDYGIDGIIEITKPIAYSQNQIVTGKRFSTQLKSSTSDKFDKKTFSVSVSKEKINYWYQSFEPVIIVLIDLKTTVAYYRWINDELINELYENSEDWIANQTVSIKFDKKKTISSKSLSELEKYVLSWKKPNKTLLTPGNYFQFSEEAYKYVNQLKELHKQYNITVLQNELNDLAKDVVSSIYTIAIIGLSRVGKSTLINSLLEKDISPMGKLPTTGIPITIFPKNENKAIVTFKDNTVIEGNADSKFLAEYSAQDKNPGNRKGVKLIRVHIVNTLLERGFALCDVPGLDDADPEIKNIAKTTIFSSNAIVYVISVAGYNEGEFRINDKNIEDLNELRGKMDRVFLVFNKIDSLNETDLKDVKTYIDSVLKQYGILEYLATPPIYISSKEAFEKRISKKKGNDTVTQLEQVLWEYLINQNRTGLHKIISNFANQLSHIERVKKITNIRLKSSDQRRALEIEISNVEQEILKLKGFVRVKRDAIYTEIKRYVVDRFENVLTHLENELNTITNSELLPTKDRISQYLENEAYKILSDVYEYLQQQSYELQSDVNAWVGEKLKQVELSLENITEKHNLNLPDITKYTSQVYSFFIENSGGYMGILENIVGGIGKALEFIFSGIFDFLTSDHKIINREIKKFLKNSTRSYNNIQTDLLQNVSDYLNGICSTILEKTNDRTNVYLGELKTKAKKLDTPLTPFESKNQNDFIIEIDKIENEINSHYNHLVDYTDGIDVFKNKESKAKMINS